MDSSPYSIEAVNDSFFLVTVNKDFYKYLEVSTRLTFSKTAYCNEQVYWRQAVI